jgi:hypothetical protein
LGSCYVQLMNLFDARCPSFSERLCCISSLNQRASHAV